MLTNQTENVLADFPTIQTNRLNLVEIKQTNLNNIYNLYSDENVTRFYNLLPLTLDRKQVKLLTGIKTGLKTIRVFVGAFH